MNPWEVPYDESGTVQQTAVNPWNVKYASQTTPGIAQQIGNNIGATQQEATASGTRLASGQQGLPESIAQGLSQGIGIVGDVASPVIGAGLKAAYDALTTQGFKDRQKLGLESVANSDIGQTVGKAGQNLQHGWNNYEQQDPAGAADLQALGTALTMGLPGKFSPNATNAAVDIAGNAIKNVAKDAPGAIIDKLTPTPIPTYAATKALSQQSFKRTDELGGMFTPEVRNQFIQTIAEQLPSKDSLAANSPITAIYKKALSQQGEPLSLKGFQEIDSDLYDAAKREILPETGEVSKEGRKLLIIKNNLKQLAENAPEDVVLGGKEGYDNLKKGVSDWATSLRLRTIEKIFDNAKNTDNEATAIKSGFRTLARNDVKMADYSPKEQELIKAGAKSGLAANTLRTTLGSRLIGTGVGTALGTVTGGPIGGAIGAATGAGASELSRMLSASLQRGRGNAVKREIGKRIYDLPERPSEVNIPENSIQLALPAPRLDPIVYGQRGESRFGTDVNNVSYSPPGPPKQQALQAPENVNMVDRQGNVWRMSDAERQAAELSRQQALQTGLTPDVRASQIRNEVTKAYEQRDLQRNAIKEEQIAKIAEQSSVPIEQLVEMADKNIKELADIVGKKNSDTAFAQALRIAIRNKGNKQ